MHKKIKIKNSRRPPIRALSTSYLGDRICSYPNLSPNFISDHKADIRRVPIIKYFYEPVPLSFNFNQPERRKDDRPKRGSDLFRALLTII